MNFISAKKIIAFSASALLLVACSDDSSSNVTDGTETQKSSVETGTLTDSRDNQTYKTVVIGDYTWMAENLNLAYKISEDSEDTLGLCYNNDSTNCKKYGRLYTWGSAMDSAAVYSDDGKGCGNKTECGVTGKVRGICPEGWHLPTNAEWENLAEAVGGADSSASKLKSENSWIGVDFEDNELIEERDVDASGTDDYGFNALPAGYFIDDEYNGEGWRTYFWTSEEYGTTTAYSWSMWSGENDIGSYNGIKRLSRSIRCVKD